MNNNQKPASEKEFCKDSSTKKVWESPKLVLIPKDTIRKASDTYEGTSIFAHS